MLITPTLLLAGCERTLNALLARDPAAPARLAALAGSRLLVRLEKPHLALLLCYHATGVDLQHGDEVEETDVDAVVDQGHDVVHVPHRHAHGVSLGRLDEVRL